MWGGGGTVDYKKISESEWCAVTVKVTGVTEKQLKHKQMQKCAKSLLSNYTPVSHTDTQTRDSSVCQQTPGGIYTVTIQTNKKKKVKAILPRQYTRHRRLLLLLLHSVASDGASKKETRVSFALVKKDAIQMRSRCRYGRI